MGNSDSKEYADDPYIQQSQQNNYNINNLYSTQSLQYSANEEAKTNVISSQQKVIKTQAIKNPLQLDRNSIKLEKDAFNPNIYYISFIYSTDREIYANFYYNSSFDAGAKDNIFYHPTQSFKNDIIRLTLEPGINKTCMDKLLILNIDYFFKYKIYDKNLTDFIIELYSLDRNRNVECILSTFCKVFNKPREGKFEMKSVCQKYKVQNSEWYNLQDIFGLSSEENLCEICYDAKKNTFFEPCKHSFACKDCAITLIIKSGKCPVCRNDDPIFYYYREREIVPDTIIKNIGITIFPSLYTLTEEITSFISPP